MSVVTSGQCAVEGAYPPSVPITRSSCRSIWIG